MGRSTPIALASFPLSSALTAANLTSAGGRGQQHEQHQQQAELLRELLQLGVLDERSVVVLHLAVERARLRAAAASDAAPWLELLPSRFGTPLFFSERDMEALRGTTLHRATE